MDIGGWTVDLMRLDNAVPNADTCRSLEWGMIRCLDGAREQVRRTMGLSVTDAQIERVLSGLPCALDEKVREVIRQQGRDVYKRQYEVCDAVGYNSVEHFLRTFKRATGQTPLQYRKENVKKHQ